MEAVFAVMFTESFTESISRAVFILVIWLKSRTIHPDKPLAAPQKPSAPSKIRGTHSTVTLRRHMSATNKLLSRPYREKGLGQSSAQSLLPTVTL